MTNKLRSVIEDADCALIAHTENQDSDYIHRVDAYRFLKMVSIDLLDAIMEEMESDEQSKGKEFISIDKEKSPKLRNFHLGGIQAVRDRIDRLKQAREELSSL